MKNLTSINNTQTYLEELEIKNRESERKGLCDFQELNPYNLFIYSLDRHIPRNHIYED